MYCVYVIQTACSGCLELLAVVLSKDAPPHPGHMGVRLMASAVGCADCVDVVRVPSCANYALGGQAKILAASV